MEFPYPYLPWGRYGYFLELHIQLNTGVSHELKHCKAANFQRQVRKILRLFSLKLFVVLIIIFFCLESPCYCISVYHEFIKRAITFRRLSQGMLKYPELALKITIIVHQTRYEKSDRSRAFNQFTIACELDMINAISAADIAFIMSSSTSAWLLSPLECSQKQNGWTLCFCFWGWIKWKMYNKTIILLNSVFAWYQELSKPGVCVICLSLRLQQITQTSVLIIHDIMLDLIQ